jgi:hypothetical protein
MWSRRVLVAFLGILAGLFDAAVSSWFPGSWIAVRVSLPLVVILAAFSSQERALTAAIAAGFVLDVFLPSFGFVTLRLAAIAFVIRALAQRFFTNRSLPGSLALGFAGIMLDRALLAGGTFLAGAWTSSVLIAEVRAGWIAEAVWMAVAMGVAFIAMAALTRRFLPPVTRR